MSYIRVRALLQFGRTPYTPQCTQLGVPHAAKAGNRHLLTGLFVHMISLLPYEAPEGVVKVTVRSVCRQL